MTKHARDTVTLLSAHTDVTLSCFGQHLQLYTQIFFPIIFFLISGAVTKILGCSPRCLWQHSYSSVRFSQESERRDYWLPSGRKKLERSTVSSESRSGALRTGPGDLSGSVLFYLSSHRTWFSTHDETTGVQEEFSMTVETHLGLFLEVTTTIMSLVITEWQTADNYLVINCLHLLWVIDVQI